MSTATATAEIAIEEGSIRLGHERTVAGAWHAGTIARALVLAGIHERDLLALEKAAQEARLRLRAEPAGAR